MIVQFLKKAALVVCVTAITVLLSGAVLYASDLYTSVAAQAEEQFGPPATSMVYEDLLDATFATAERATEEFNAAHPSFVSELLKWHERRKHLNTEQLTALDFSLSALIDAGMFDLDVILPQRFVKVVDEAVDDRFVLGCPTPEEAKDVVRLGINMDKRLQHCSEFDPVRFSDISLPLDRIPIGDGSTISEIMRVTIDGMSLFIAYPFDVPPELSMGKDPLVPLDFIRGVAYTPAALPPAPPELFDEISGVPEVVYL